MDRETVRPIVDSFPGARARQWVEFHQGVAAPSTHVYDFVWDVTADAIGPFCTDVDGNVLLDFTSHVASSPLGYNNPKIMEALAEFDVVDPLKIAGQDFYASGGWPVEAPAVPGPTQLMDALVSMTAEYDLDTVFLSNSGAEAVENAIKICYDHRDGAKYGFTFDGAFHGRTLGALSLNRSKAVHRRGFPEISGISAIPYCSDRSCSPQSCSCGFFPDVAEPSRLRRVLDPQRGYIDPAEVAFVILEPMQGEGGYRIPSKAFMTEIGEVCELHGIPLIADEVQTGIGRSGEFWCVDHYDVEPDVIVAGKSLRVGATISRREIFPAEKARLSSTWGSGDLIASLQGVLTLAAIEEYDLVENARRRGEQLVNLIEAINSEYIVDVRGLGLLVGVEFDTRDRRDAMIECCLKGTGLLTLPCGTKTLRLLPPLDVTDREIELGVSCFTDALAYQDVREASPHFSVSEDAS